MKKTKIGGSVKPKPVIYYSKQADKLLQEIGRIKYSRCEACGRLMSCAHHYYKKSSAGNLRYNWLNLIPICQSCHFLHHNGNPDIQNNINKNKGEKWLKELQEAKKIPNSQCNTKSYYKAKIEELKLELKQYEHPRNKNTGN